MRCRATRSIAETAFVVGWLAVIAGCQRAADTRRAETVVVYTSVDDVFVRPICQRFEQDTGIEVKLVPDTEETKSAGLLNRLIAERDRPQADVFWSGDPVRASILKVRGVSAVYRSPESADLPPQFSDSDGHWTGFSCRARVIVYNRNLVSPGAEPQSVRDLADPRYSGRACIANPLFGTTSMHAAALFAAWGDAAARKFFDDFAGGGGRLLSSNGEVRRRVAAGEFAIGLADSDDYNVARQEGQPVGVVYPDQDELGTLIVPNCLVLIAGAPHAAAGRRLIDYLLRPEVEQALAESEAAQMPVRAGVPTPAHVKALADLRPMAVNYAGLGERSEGLSRGFLKAWVDHNLQ